MVTTTPLGLYIHIPFCHVRCNFCNLHAYGMGDYHRLPDLRAAYTHALRQEVAWWAAEVGRLPVTTVFFGGGTPTELTHDQLGSILDTVRDQFEVLANAEITIEAYPGLSRAYLTGLRGSGVNRVSFGVQSFDPGLLTLLDRQHTQAEVAQTIMAARELGFSVALDFIYGLPTQTIDQWRDTLDQAMALRPDHLSLYALSIEEATRLRALIKQGILPMPDPDLTAEMYHVAQARLADAGYDHYELSNWARLGHACRHNQVYWRNEPWLGLGSGAYGFFRGERTTNILSPTQYVKAVLAGQSPVGNREIIPRETEISETIMLGLRLRSGLDLDRFEQRFGKRFEDMYVEPLDDLIREGFVRLTDNKVVLTNKSLLISNEVLVHFVLP